MAELDRAACLLKGYRIRAAIDRILEVTDVSERREFNEEFIRPDTLHDVADAAEILRGEVNTLRECGIGEFDARKAEELAAAIPRAVSANDTALMANTITQIYSLIKRGK